MYSAHVHKNNNQCLSNALKTDWKKNQAFPIWGNSISVEWSIFDRLERKKHPEDWLPFVFVNNVGKTHEEDANAKICKWKKSLENYKIKIK